MLSQPFFDFFSFIVYLLSFIFSYIFYLEFLGTILQLKFTRRMIASQILIYIILTSTNKKVKTNLSTNFDIGFVYNPFISYLIDFIKKINALHHTKI